MSGPTQQQAEPPHADATRRPQEQALLEPREERRSERPFWHEVLAPYAEPDLGRSLLDLATSVVPYLGLMVAMYFALGVSYLLVLATAIPASAATAWAPEIRFSARTRSSPIKPGRASW